MKERNQNRSLKDIYKATKFKNIMNGTLISLVLIFLVVLVYTYNIELPSVFSGIETMEFERFFLVYLIFGIISIVLIISAIVSYIIANKHIGVKIEKEQ